MKKLLGKLAYVNPANLSKEINKYGYTFSFKNFLMIMGLAYIGFIILGWLYKLHLVPILIIIAVLTFVVPLIILQSFKQLYHFKMFDDCNNYMEQMMYSFKRRGKVLSALQDTLAIFPDGVMHEDILEAIAVIQYAQTDNNIFSEAFKAIEKDFGCKRLYTLHDFLVNIENRGGEHDASVDILLKDRKLWVERIHEFEREKKSVKTKTLIGITLAMIVGYTAVEILPDQLAVYDLFPSQIVTTLVFIFNILMFYLANRLVSASLLDDALTPSMYAQMKRDYDKVYKYGPTYKAKQYKIIAATFAAIAVIMAGMLISKKMQNASISNTMIAMDIMMVALAVLMLTQPKRSFKSAVKRTRREVEKAFPDWLLNMALLLQTNNVHVAITESVKDAPPILRPELRALVQGIERHPNSIEPFMNFFQTLDMPDIQSAMKILYSMAEFGSKDITDQINTLVDRNAVLTDRAERLIAEDKLSLASLFILSPMLSGVLKLVVDMALIVFSLLKFVNLGAMGY